MLICFIFVLILGLIGTGLECVVSFLYRKNAAASYGTPTPQGNQSGAPSQMELQQRGQNNVIQGNVVVVQQGN